MDQNARGSAELEKAARGILSYRRVLESEGRREGRQVMRLLTQAAERTVVPTLSEVLALACGLISVLANSRLLGRAKGLAGQLENRLDAFLQRRYGDLTGESFDIGAELKQIQTAMRATEERGRHIKDQLRAEGVLPPRRKRQPQEQAAGAPEPRADAKRRKRKKKAPQPEPFPPTGPDLPATFEEFRALVGRAFFAPSAEPGDKAIRRLLDEIAWMVWDRLHVVPEALEYGKQRWDEVLGEMAQAPPGATGELTERRCEIVAVVSIGLFAEQRLAERNQRIRPCLGRLMRQRYGLKPEVERFSQTDWTIERVAQSFAV